MVSGKKRVFLDGILGGVFEPGGDAMFSALDPVPDDFPFDIAVLVRPAATDSGFWLLSPMSAEGVISRTFFVLLSLFSRRITDRRIRGSTEGWLSSCGSVPDQVNIQG